jgi:hypothetical protein
MDVRAAFARERESASSFLTALVRLSGIQVSRGVLGRLDMLARIKANASERQHFPLEKSDKPSDISNAMRLVRLAAEPRQVGDSIKGAINRAARVLTWTPTRTRDIWYGGARRLDVAEMDALRALERKKLEADFIAERRRNIEQVAVLRTRLQHRDSDFHREDIAALDWMLRELRAPEFE